MTGLQWMRQSGQLTSAIGLTNSHSVGVVRDALAAIDCESRQPGHLFWSLPVAGETWDGVLNDINGLHVQAGARAAAPTTAARRRPVAEGSVGGGTGMICYMFKGGIGTSSRVLPPEMGGYTVGVLVQANFGWRDDYVVNGAPVGRELNGDVIPLPAPPEFDVHPPAGSFVPMPGAGSIVGIAATDAPLLPYQCDALAQRVGLGVVAHRQLGRPLERRHLRRLLHGQPAAGLRPHVAGPSDHTGDRPLEQLPRSACTTAWSRRPRRPSSTRSLPPAPWSAVMG